MNIFMYINLFTHVVQVLWGAHGMSVPQCTYEGQRTIYQNQPFVSTMWVLAIELKLSCLTFFFCIHSSNF